MDREGKFYEAIHSYVPGELANWLRTNGFFTAPASTKYHGSYPGGLFDHSLSVMEILVELTEKNGLSWQMRRSPYIVGMFHDLCKIDQYEQLPEYPVFVYRTNIAPGHGDKSVALLAKYYDLTEEERLCIRYHMGAFVEKAEWREYTQAVNRYATVLWTHHADMIASHVKGV